MTDNKFEARTDHILYIVANARYDCYRGDSDCFNKTIDILNSKIHDLSLRGAYYLPEYIAGMYPEFDGALKYFSQKASARQKENHGPIPGAMLSVLARETILKFKLNNSYDVAAEPSAEQLKRLNSRIMPEQKKDMNEYGSPVLKDMAVALMETGKDFRPVHSFIDSFKNINRVLSGQTDKQTAEKHTDIEGVSFGLQLLKLKEQGIINNELEIADLERFCADKSVTQFSVNGKTYNLSAALKAQKSPKNRTTNRVIEVNS